MNTYIYEQRFINLCTLVNDKVKIERLGGSTEYLDKLINYLKIELDIDEIDCIMMK